MNGIKQKKQELINKRTYKMILTPKSSEPEIKFCIDYRSKEPRNYAGAVILPLLISLIVNRTAGLWKQFFHDTNYQYLSLVIFAVVNGKTDSIEGMIVVTISFVCNITPAKEQLPINSIFITIFTFGMFFSRRMH